MRRITSTIGALTFLCAASVTLASFLNGSTDKRKAYVQGEPVPEMSSRGAGLVPGPIPRRVRYAFDSDAHVKSAAEALAKAVAARDGRILKESVMLLPGAYRHFGRMLAAAGAKSNMSAVDPSDLKKGKLNGGMKMGFVDKPDQLSQVFEGMCQRLKDGGGYSIRALKTDEMAHWWVFIMFDIEEPAFVLESKDGRYRFVVEMNDEGKVAILDELNALPARS